MAKRKKKAKKEEKKPKKKRSKAKKKTKKKKRRRKKKGGGSLLVFLLLVIAIGAVIFISKAKSGAPVKYLKAQKLAEWGSAGSKPGQLDSPRGVAVSDDGKVYVSDLNNSRVNVYTGSGKFIKSWGKKGDKKGQFNEPSGISIGPKGNVFVADSWNGRIQKFDSNGKYLLQIGGAKAGFYSPRNAAVNKYGVLYVADTGTSRIHRFDTEGHRLGNPVGGAGKSLDKFNEVFGIAFDSKGRVYVADVGNRRVVVLSSDLRPEAQIKIKPWSDAFPLWPMLAVDTKDLLYVVSSGTQEICLYDTKDKKFKYAGTIKNDVKGKPLFANPLGLDVDNMDNVYVTELSRNKVLKIKPEIQ